jgi:ParB family chromosome partitioning protein
MKRRDVVRALLVPEESRGDAATPPASRRVPAHAVRAMGLQLDHLTEAAREAARLGERLAGGEAVVALDPAVVDPSFATDRLARTGDRDYRRLVDSMRERGQLVPILVRPHPERPGRYQVAYGHRRLEAAAELGVAVKAVVRALSDAELVIAQGRENAERRNLSFIERALFAARLAAAGFDRATLNAALGVHTAEMTRLLAVASGVPAEVAQAIGPAPKAGRPRWMVFVGALAEPDGPARLWDLMAQPAWQRMPTDRRFETALAALQATGEAPLGAGPAPIRLERRGPILRLTIDERHAPGLGRLVLERLGDLLPGATG